jgi:hypothetical protein
MIAFRNMNRFKEVTKIEIGATYYERTDKCGYLGSVLNESDDVEMDVRAL